MIKVLKKIYHFYTKNFVLDVNSQKFINHNKTMIKIPDTFFNLFLISLGFK